MKQEEIKCLMDKIDRETENSQLVIKQLSELLKIDCAAKGWPFYELRRRLDLIHFFELTDVDVRDEVQIQEIYRRFLTGNGY